MTQSPASFLTSSVSVIRRMGFTTAARTLAGLIAPPRCGICADPCAPAGPLCAACTASLRHDGGRHLLIPGADAAWAATEYADVSRRLVSALKFGGRLQLAAAAAGAIADQLPEAMPVEVIVPVPSSPARRRARGFDPAALIARALAGRLAVPYLPLLARKDGPRQVGRRRRERLADPPAVAAREPAPAVATVVDDVTTTGATLAACAAALRAAGSSRVDAIAFAHAS